MEMISVLDISQLKLGEGQKDFYVNRIPPHIAENHSKITRPHKHNSYLTILFTKGSGRHEIDFNSYEIKPGSLFVLAPGKTHHWELSEDIDGYIFSHTANFYDLHYSHNRLHQFPFFYSIQNTPFLALDSENSKKTEHLFRKLLDEYESAKNFQQQLIISYIDIIYIELSRLYLIENAPKIIKSGAYSEKFQQFEDLIEKNYITEKSPSQYADWMNISPKHLNRITKTIIGKTASEVITDRIILEAKRRFLHTKNNFSAIAESLGYDDYAYFSKLFKKSSGLTPTGFLKLY
ncbi:helix-turn-helix domain-containing protein [Flavobacterium lindanitolerans]|uniref:AraC-like DNA-binding protein n=1 Tax=Flavobacterium lindanitolerans TaxID=428988 RepID=A0A497UIN6_9FLAO|nr:helix-turn-helix domain-containing protein [Flavobacterium lindanitolerans]PKW30163.1 AraC-like DNA-binding protein [Flavobacterium lindanitolerans]RLJ24503.1 AraC-like DNA-binding protein [Flavobacterium lindanitolerans]